MSVALKVTTTVLPGHRIEVATPDLPEGARVELVISELSEPSSSVQDADNSSHASIRYPANLNAEYDLLIRTQRQRQLSASEQTRLDAIKAEIDAIDAASCSGDVFTYQMSRIHDQIVAIRLEIESLGLPS